MKLKTITGLLLLVFAAAALGRQDKEPVDALKARAASAEGKKQVELLLEIAQRQMKAVDDLYSAGSSEQAQIALKDVVDYGTQACDAAAESGKRMKQTEIAVRKLAKRLDEIAHSVSFEDRPPVKAAVDALEKARSNLLQRMFKK